MPNVILGEAIKRWIDDLSAALQLYMESHKIKSVADLARRLGLDERAMQMVVKGDRVFTQNIEFYAEIYDQLGILEADPRQIPDFESFEVDRQNLRTTKPLAWSEARYAEWHTGKPTAPPRENESEQSSSHPILSDPAYIKHREEEIALAKKMSEALRSYLQEKDMSAAQLARKIGIPSRWVSAVVSNRHVISSNADYYALLYHHTNLAVLDPRALPARWMPTRNGGIAYIVRGWSDEKFAKWAQAHEQTIVKQPEATLESYPEQLEESSQPALSAPAPKLADEKPAVTENQSDPEEPRVHPELNQLRQPQLSKRARAIGAAIDLLLTAFVLPSGLVSSQNTNLDAQLDRLTGVVDRLETVTAKDRVVPETPLGLSSAQKQAVVLGRQLLRQLQAIRNSSEEERGQFVASSGQLMADLLMLIRGFTIQDKQQRRVYFETLQEV